MNIVAELRTTGRAMLESFTPTQMDDINRWLSTRAVYTDAHVPITAIREGRPLEMRGGPEEQQSECICFRTTDAIVTPHIFERALSLTDVAAEYLRCETPMMFSANAFFTKPGTAPERPDIQEWHKDIDDPKGFLALFVFLKDTRADGRQELEGPDGIVRATIGPTGAAFLADTSRRHRGLKPQHAERGLFWFRWGVTEIPDDKHAYCWDEIKPISPSFLGDRYPTDPRLQKSIRLLVA